MVEISQQIFNDALKASGNETLAKEFAEAYAEVPNLATRPKNDELLQLYALSKQALQNPPFEKKEEPSSWAFQEHAKWKAWKKVYEEGVSPADAQKQYIALVKELKQKYGMKA
ncbi:hypothetical protein VTN77DRAFT_7472 [Rasamsonia byssochlamydoides]|uniref:uncharacterized protein n=1 Tax=Rasamsonia byssochlamydoides TaxID=89139 RepID=UPI003743358D